MLWAGQALPGPKGLKGRRQTGDGLCCWLPPWTEPGALQLSSLFSKPWCQLQFGIMTLKGNRVIKLGWLGHRKTDKKQTLWVVLSRKGGQLRSWATGSHGSGSLQEYSGPGRALPPLHAESCLFPSLRSSMPTTHLCENPFLFLPRFFSGRTLFTSGISVQILRVRKPPRLFWHGKPQNPPQQT